MLVYFVGSTVPGRVDVTPEDRVGDAAFKFARSALTEATRSSTAAYPSSGDLFRATRGQALRYGAWKSVWVRATAETGLTLTTHDLRHFYASGLIAGGASVKQVQVVLGHASPVMTLKIYAHLWPGDEDRIRTISDAALDGLRTVCGLEAV